MRSEGCSIHIRTDLLVRMIADAFPIKITVIAAKIENDIAGIRASYGVDETVEDLLSPFDGTSESRFVEHAYAELFSQSFTKDVREMVGRPFGLTTPWTIESPNAITVVILCRLSQTVIGRKPSSGFRRA